MTTLYTQGTTGWGASESNTLHLFVFCSQLMRQNGTRWCKEFDPSKHQVCFDCQMMEQSGTEILLYKALLGGPTLRVVAPGEAEGQWRFVRELRGEEVPVGEFPKGTSFDVMLSQVKSNLYSHIAPGSWYSVVQNWPEIEKAFVQFAQKHPRI